MNREMKRKVQKYIKKNHKKEVVLLVKDAQLLSNELYHQLTEDEKPDNIISGTILTVARNEKEELEGFIKAVQEEDIPYEIYNKGTWE